MVVQRKIKCNAKRALSGNWGNAIVILFLFSCLELLFSIVSTLSGYMMGINAVFDIYNTPEIFLDNIPDITLFTLGFNIFMVVVYVLLRDPLQIGKCSWYSHLASGDKPEALSIFAYFSNHKAFFRSIWININIRIRKFFWGILLYALPTVSITAGFLTVNAYKGVSEFYVVLGSVLLFCGVTLLGLFSAIAFIIFQKYFLAPYYMVTKNVSASKAISLSIKTAKGFKTKIALFHLSFIGWRILNVLIIPLLYTQPYMETSKAMYARYLIEMREGGFQHETKTIDSPSGDTICFDAPKNSSINDNINPM